MTDEQRTAKLAELATYLPEQVHPPSRAEIEAWQKTDAFDQAVRTNKVREAMNALCTREPTRVIVGEPDTSGWTPDMLRLYAACKSARRPFTLKDGHSCTMYMPNEAALDRVLSAARAFDRLRGES